MDRESGGRARQGEEEERKGAWTREEEEGGEQAKCLDYIGSCEVQG